MKFNKLLSLAVLAVGVSAFAQTVDGYVGVGSNNMYRGETLSEDKASANFGLGVTVPVSKLRVRGAVDVSTVRDNGVLVNTSAIVSAPIGVATVYGGAINHATVVDSFRKQKNINEAVVGIKAPLLGGNAFTEYSREPITGDIKTDYLKVGYSHSVFNPKLVLGASALYSKDVGNLTPSHNTQFYTKSTEVYVKYNLTKNLSATATAIRSKSDIFATKSTNKYLVGANYSF